MDFDLLNVTGGGNYPPIGKLYLVRFLDVQRCTYNVTVAVPAKDGVETALLILERAYPGCKVEELKLLEVPIVHGYLDQRKYPPKGAS